MSPSLDRIRMYPFLTPNTFLPFWPMDEIRAFQEGLSHAKRAPEIYEQASIKKWEKRIAEELNRILDGDPA